MEKEAALEKTLTKAEKKVRRLYALVWLLACPLVFVVASLLGFTQINIVYWTLLIVPVLLAVYNVRQVPPARVKPKAVHGVPVQEEDAQPAAQEAPEGVSPVKRAQFIALALKLPVVIALPILATVLVDLVLRLRK